jgi:uncharacterized repeat protein (TIGR01451 family)
MSRNILGILVGLVLALSASVANAVLIDIKLEKLVNGEDADQPPGPEVQVGDTVVFTYKVTNTGDVDLTITSLFDDNGTPPLPPGTGDDDFEPQPILVDVQGTFYNIGDINIDNFLTPAEIWQFTSSAVVMEAGLQTNVAKVVAEDADGSMVMDDDTASYVGVPEPTILALLSLGLAGLGFTRRRMKA